MLKHLAIGFALTLSCLSAPAHSGNQTMVLQPHKGGTLYVDAMLADSVQATLLVDTGASMLTINQHTFNQLSEQTDLFYSHNLGFRNANGKINKVKVYILPQLTLGDTCHLQNVEVAVMAGGNNILGMNVLAQFAPISLNIFPPTLELSNCDAALIAQHEVTD